MGLDLSLTATGLSVVNPQEMKILKELLIETSSATPMGARLAKIRDTAVRIAQEFEVRDVAVEQYSVGPIKRSRVAETYYLHGQVGMGLWENGFDSPLMIAPPTLKKWMTDDGKADKSDVRVGAQVKLKQQLHPNHNVVDADCLAYMLAQYHRWMRGLFAPTKYQLKVMRDWKRML